MTEQTRENKKDLIEVISWGCANAAEAILCSSVFPMFSCIRRKKKRRIWISLLKKTLLMRVKVLPRQGIMNAIH